MKIIYIPSEITDEESEKILNFARERADVLELIRYANFKLDEKIIEEVNAEWLDFVKTMDKERREKFENDSEFRESLLEDLELEEDEVFEYFDTILKQDLSIISEEDELADYDNYLDEDVDLDELEELDFMDYYSVDDFEDVDIEEEETRILSALKEEGLVPVTATLEDLDELDEYVGDVDAIETYEEGENDILGNIAYSSERSDYLETVFSRVSPVSYGPIFEISRFNLETAILDLAEQLDLSLFKFPLKFDGFEFEDPVFALEGRPILSICSHENFAVMHLTDEEYEDFKALDVKHEI